MIMLSVSLHVNETQLAMTVIQLPPPVTPVQAKTVFYSHSLSYILPLVTSTFQKCSSGSLAATVYHLKLLKSIKRCFVAVDEYDNL